MPSERLTKLLGMLERRPGDPFLLYAIGLEHKQADEYELAIQFLDRCVQFDPGYSYAFYQKGQILELQGEIDGAKQAYAAGVASAKAKGDAHAESEIGGALEMVS